MKKIVLLLTLGVSFAAQAQMSLVSNFGTNPGALTMYQYVPANPVPSAGVVLVMHGCGQLAADFANETGWNVLAEQYGFYVIHAGQSTMNNGSKCFNWFSPFDNVRDAGEAKSLAQMVDYMHTTYATNPSKTFVCGLSAGGSMTPVMMATYPEKFKKGGIWAGVPYKYSATGGNNNKTPQQWGDDVRNANPNYVGAYPTLFICQGTNDNVVDPINEERLVNQWTNVHGADQTTDGTNFSFDGNANVKENIYKSTNLQDTIVITYTVTNMAHGIAVDPGNGTKQGGQTSLGAFDVDFFSTYWMAKFFGLISANTTSVSKIEQKDISFIQNQEIIQLQAKSEQALTFNLYSFSGQRIMNKPFTNSLSQDITGLANGMYIVTVENTYGQKVFSRVINR